MIKRLWVSVLVLASIGWAQRFQTVTLSPTSTPARYYTLGSSAPELDFTHWAAAVNINGATATNGNIVLNPGNVAGNASVAVNAARGDQPALYLKSASGTTTAPVFTLRDASNVAHFFVMQSGDASCPNCVNAETVLPISTTTFALGSSSKRWSKVWTGDIDISGTCTGCTSFPIVFPGGTASPQLDATGLGDALNINGSSSVNGNIVLNPGAVAGNASVFVNAARTDLPGLVVKNHSGVTTGNVWEIQDSSGVAAVRVVGSGAGSGLAPSSLFVGLASTDLGLVGPSLVAQDIVASVSATSNASGISIAATPGSGGADLSVFKTGSGTLLPLRFFRNPNEVARFDTSNRFLLGATADDGTGSLLQVNGVVDAVTGFYSNSSASNAVNIPNGGVLAVNGTFGVSPNYIVVQKTAPQIDASSLGAAFNINGASATNGNIVFNPGNVLGLSSVVINGHSNGTTTQSLVINEAGSPLGSGISMTHGGTFDAAWQAGTGSAFDVVSNNGSSHRFVIDQSGHVLVARTSDDGSGFVLQVSGSESIAGDIVPLTTTTYDLGSSSKRWSTVYGGTGNFSSGLTLGSASVTPSGSAVGFGGGITVGGLITSVNGIATVGMGQPLIVDHNLISGQTTTASVSLLEGGSTPPAGDYRVSIKVGCTATGTDGLVVPGITAADGSPVGGGGTFPGPTAVNCGASFGGVSAGLYAPVVLHSNGSGITLTLTVGVAFAGGASYYYEYAMERLN